MESPSYLFTSESVTEGHPDKLCDQISDAVLDAILKEDPMARVACETCTTTGLVIVMGEITTTSYIDMQQIVRSTIRDAGYVDSSYGFDYQSCGIVVSVHEQSPDIAHGVTRSLEVRSENSSDYEIEAIGAGDQGMMVGFACNETPELMPLPIALSHSICQKMAERRKDGTFPWMRPDGKSQVTVEYEYGKPKRVHTVIMSTQHNPEV
ncbi:MAG: methionine adenosyltransferase, partial [Chloroflexi bacterium]|nr:methionine adenosyltransferase [Chloroflexota bacterium]